jgi:Na+-driven multidrug efflux pump
MSVGFSILAAVVLITSGPFIMELFVGEGQQEVVDMGHMYLIVNGVNYWILALLFIFRYTLQGLGQSVVPTIAGVMELLMRAGAAIFLCEIWGYFGACVANPMAWAGSCIPLAIAFFWTRRTFRKKYS